MTSPPYAVCGFKADDVPIDSPLSRSKTDSEMFVVPRSTAAPRRGFVIEPDIQDFLSECHAGGISLILVAESDFLKRMGSILLPGKISECGSELPGGSSAGANRFMGLSRGTSRFERPNTDFSLVQSSGE